MPKHQFECQKCGETKIVELPPEKSAPPRTLMEKRNEVSENADCCSRPRYR